MTNLQVYRMILICNNINSRILNSSKIAQFHETLNKERAPKLVSGFLHYTFKRKFSTFQVTPPTKLIDNYLSSYDFKYENFKSVPNKYRSIFYQFPNTIKHLQATPLFIGQVLIS